MNKDPDIIINIGGTHSAKQIVAGVIANALEQSGVKMINHIDYDQVTFTEMRKAISESTNNLSTASIMIVEWEDDEMEMHTPLDDANAQESPSSE